MLSPMFGPEQTFAATDDAPTRLRRSGAATQRHQRIILVTLHEGDDDVARRVVVWSAVVKCLMLSRRGE